MKLRVAMVAWSSELVKDSSNQNNSNTDRLIRQIPKRGGGGNAPIGIWEGNAATDEANWWRSKRGGKRTNWRREREMAISDSIGQLRSKRQFKGSKGKRI